MIPIEQLLKLHDLSINFYGGSTGVRDMNLLESAIARPFQTFAGQDLYSTVFDKTAAIIESVIKNHPFVDGNKRTGFLAAFVFLKQNNISLTASESEAYEFVIKIASSQISFEEIVNWLQQNSQQIEQSK
jgi:death-on-curing protein